MFDSEFAVSLQDVHVLHPKFNQLIYNSGQIAVQQMNAAAAAQAVSSTKGDKSGTNSE